MKSLFCLWIVSLCVVLQCLVEACTDIIVSPGASKDGSSIISYNQDTVSLYGSLYHYPAADHPAGTMRDVYDWDSGRYLGQIEEAAHTYNVVGNVNEYGVIIGETTYGGLLALEEQDGAIMDYGSLIWVALQRSRTAREAIQTISDLMSRYGYASEGESFSIGDQSETWVMEIIGKGNYEKGAVWVAQRVPDGYICAHANQARIRTFALNDPENSLYSSDVISFARKIGVYPADARDEDFSFSDTYDAVTFEGARFCDARVWSVFSTVMGSDWSNQYLDYAQGKNLTNRMPLFVKPPNDAKISVVDVMDYMRSHYENTGLDMSGTLFPDVGAMIQSPYRAHPLTWSSTIEPDGVTVGDTPIDYVHERPIGTPQTGWNSVAQSRKWMPREFAALLWFGVDDSSTTVRFPIYGSATRVPENFAGKGKLFLYLFFYCFSCLFHNRYY
jgi:dipeptidase